MIRFVRSIRLFSPLAGWLLLVTLPLACVDPEESILRGTVDVIVVDGTITNLAEPQIIRLNRSRADPLTGRFGVLPLTKLSVQVIEDSARMIDCHETIDGTYQLPLDFKGQVGHAYQLRFTLSDGAQYTSSQQVMAPVPPIDKVTAVFNPTSLPVNLLGGFTKGYDLRVDLQDPAGQRNFYRWDWTLYEQQYWCRTCNQGYYMTNKLTLLSSYPSGLVYRAEPDLLEDCFDAPSSLLTGPTFVATPYFVNDYTCRTQCWEIIHSSQLNLFSDQYTNGGPILNRTVGQVPYYTHNHALLEIRQTSLTPDAYRFLTLFQQQTQNTGGLADTPPAALVGNVRNVRDAREKVVGFFTAGAVSIRQYWLDKKDASGIPLGGVDDHGKVVPGEQELFFALNRRLPIREPQKSQEYTIGFAIIGGVDRPPTAVCFPSDNRTPFRPDGWRD